MNTQSQMMPRLSLMTFCVECFQLHQNRTRNLKRRNPANSRVFCLEDYLDSFEEIMNSIRFDLDLAEERDRQRAKRVQDVVLAASFLERIVTDCVQYLQNVEGSSSTLH